MLVVIYSLAVWCLLIILFSWCWFLWIVSVYFCKIYYPVFHDLDSIILISSVAFFEFLRYIFLYFIILFFVIMILFSCFRDPDFFELLGYIFVHFIILLYFMILLTLSCFSWSCLHYPVFHDPDFIFLFSWFWFLWIFGVYFCIFHYPVISLSWICGADS